MGGQGVLVTVEGDVAQVTLSRPPVNAIDLAMVQALEATFRDLAARPEIKAVVLTGEGATFSAGVDVRAFAVYSSDGRREMVLAITRMTSALLAFPGPLVAAVNGHALGGGFVLMLCCDYRLAADDPALRLGLPEAQAGVPFPAGPVRIITAELPPTLLRWLALSSETTSPAALVAHGVVDGLTAADTLLADAMAAARKLAAQRGFITVKRQVRGGLQAELAALAAAGTDGFLDAFG